MQAMKAVNFHRYGSPAVLELEDVDLPVLEDDQVLLRVRAASVNPYDWHFMRGKPYMVHLVAGLTKPKDSRLGADVAGRVEAVGANVQELQPGDEVFGSCAGAFAEFARARERSVVPKPANLTFEQAAAVPIAAITALQALRDAGQIQPGQKVLIVGAAGGVGTFAVQLAKSFGADVTGVCSTRNLELVRSIGADHVIDYTKENFTRSEQRFDLILDAAVTHSLSACRRVLSADGRYVVVGGTKGRLLGGMGRIMIARVLSLASRKKTVGLLAKITKADLLVLNELLESGEITPVIDRRYSLSEVPEAIAYLEEGHARGKVVITT